MQQSAQLKCAVVLSLLTTLVYLQATACAYGQEQYFLQGKPVTKVIYDANDLFNQGILLLRQNKCEEAVDKFRQSLAIEPDLAPAHHGLAMSLSKLGRNDEALAEFQKSVALDPLQAAAWLSMGALYQSTGKVDEAIKTYKEFLTRFPNNSEASKIASLTQGLRQMQTSLNPPATINYRSSTFPPSADDYLAVVEKDGIHRWPRSRMPVRVFIAQGEAVEGYNPTYGSILKASFNDWADISNGLVSFAFVNDPLKADLVCSWIGDARYLANSAEAGETRLVSDRLGIVSGTIKILTVPLSYELPLTENRLRRTCLHEIGHALGLIGHTNNSQDIMFYSSTITDDFHGLGNRDKNSLIRLYSSQNQG